MSKLVQRRWTSDLSGMVKRDRQSRTYEAYVPNHLVGRSFTFDGEVDADLADAEAAIARLNVAATSLVDAEALARIHLRAEALASSRIEGLEIGARSLLHTEVVRSMQETASEVLNNIDAMVFAVERVGAGDPMTVGLLLEVHRRLLVGTRLEQYGGQLREEQNWIGGSDYNPCSAVFVPPPPDHVDELMEDLCAFCCTDDLPAVARGESCQDHLPDAGAQGY